MADFDREQVAKKLADLAFSEDGCSIFDQVSPAFNGQSQKEVFETWKLADEKSKQRTKETGQSPVVDFKAKRHPDVPLSEFELDVQITDPRIDPPHQSIFNATRSEGFGFRGDWKKASCHRPDFVSKDKK